MLDLSSQTVIDLDLSGSLAVGAEDVEHLSGQHDEPSIQVGDLDFSSFLALEVDRSPSEGFSDRFPWEALAHV